MYNAEVISRTKKMMDRYVNGDQMEADDLRQLKNMLIALGNDVAQDLESQIKM